MKGLPMKAVFIKLLILLDVTPSKLIFVVGVEGQQ